ncbi:uncharacterized protein EI90DRAFT_3049442 [Cantharellus anzutake]|uniref:uncharacterized protein n=1 Tax=Cantharellus anzutake TaxID=1750568 RepID=UPI0019050561|nr:uncharacterized protein EI90DRAFT_3049442 [Cantharellus anzutake]KAF8334593.1 hypothetical protein EI90DRAFT_3049442 [Cantharellus anzutake]
MEVSIEPPRKSWKHATGIRRGIRVDNMISVDAPTHYQRPPGSVAPYNTSTWALPKGGSPTSDTHSAPRLHRSALSPLQLPQDSRLYDDSLDDEVGLGSAESDDQKYLITAEDGELVSVADSPEACKRRQNTVAARQSRQRKLEYVRLLETQVAEFQSERDGA